MAPTVGRAPCEAQEAPDREEDQGDAMKQTTAQVLPRWLPLRAHLLFLGEHALPHVCVAWMLCLWVACFKFDQA